MSLISILVLCVGDESCDVFLFKLETISAIIIPINATPLTTNAQIKNEFSANAKKYLSTFKFYKWTIYSK